MNNTQSPNMASAQKAISANLHSLHTSLRVAQILSVTAGYSQKKKDSVQAVLIQLYTDLPSLSGSVTNYPDYIGLASRLPNSIGSVQRLPDDIGLVPVILTTNGGLELNPVNIIYLVRHSNHVNDIHSVQPFGSMPRDCSSLRRTRLIHVASDVSPSFFISDSSCSLNSCGSRIWYWSVLVLSLDIVITILVLSELCNYNVIAFVLQPKKQNPAVLPTLTGLLTTTLYEVTLWLCISLPKVTPNLNGVSSHASNPDISPLKPAANRKPVLCCLMLRVFFLPVFVSHYKIQPGCQHEKQ